MVAEHMNEHTNLRYEVYEAIRRSVFEAIKKGDSNSITPILSSHLNAGLARMGNLIRTDYKQYFVLDEKDNEYWLSYNEKLLK